MSIFREKTISSILGYTDKVHVAPGGTVDVHLHSPGPVDVQLIELTSNITGACSYPSGIDGRYTPGMPELPRGSGMTVSAGVPLPENPHISLWIWPTMPKRGDRQGIISWGSDYGLFISADGKIEAQWNRQIVVTNEPVLSERWSHVNLVFDGGACALTVRTFDGGEALSSTVTDKALKAERCRIGQFYLAAIESTEGRQGCFDGKIADPAICDGDKPLAKWALGDTPASFIVPDLSGNNRTGTLFNRPQKGMTGPFYDGDSIGWKDAPDQYNAVAFHRDDLSDARWPSTFTFTVPADMPSGAYGFEIRGDTERDTIPFFVTPPPDRTTAPVAFVVPLFSYLAYANERHWWTNPAIEEIAGAPLDEIIGPLERWGEANELISLYDYHSDGTGNAHASLKRPLVNMRADYRHPLLRGPHQLSGDILILEWLRSIGQPVDILTDYCLHERGVDALRNYQCVITGSHPEYVSTEILNAFDAYLGKGGNLINMGGNAFYFVVSLYEDEPHIMEVRRGVCGTIPWQSEPGESRQAATGELSGLWRWRGRSAHKLLGTGTAVVSFGKARPFVRIDAENKNEFEWVFEGVGTSVIDAAGYLLQGPAGFEIDAMRYDLGTPANTIKLAVADNFAPPLFQALEDIIGTGVKGEAACHMAYRKLQSGGQVFSVPSISWTSCLSSNRGRNSVATITHNVIKRFLGGHKQEDWQCLKP